MIAALAEVNRAPFDMPEAEQELVAGYHSEYSGMKFALFFMAEYIKMIAVSAIAATMFLGGYKLPFIELPAIFGPAILMAKIIVLLFGMIWVRATLPRFRYDRLMAFGWKVMLPLALLSVFVTAVIMVIIG
jgi:NADH-quinone oxidoreductase subunit H